MQQLFEEQLKNIFKIFNDHYLESCTFTYLSIFDRFLNPNTLVYTWVVFDIYLVSFSYSWTVNVIVSADISE